MKLKIIRNDGVVIELDGTSDEVKAVIGTVLPAQAFSISYPSTGTIPSTWPIYDTCSHEYPSPWLGTIPPNCTKCGKAAY